MKNLKGTILTFVMILVLLASVSPSGMVEAQAATSVSISKKKATLSVGEKLTLSLKGAKGSITNPTHARSLSLTIRSFPQKRSMSFATMVLLR